MRVDPTQDGAKEFIFLTLWIFAVISWYEVRGVVWMAQTWTALVWEIVHGIPDANF